MSTKASIAYNFTNKDKESFHLYRDMSNDAIYLECTAEASLDSSGSLSVNLSSFPPELIAYLSKQLAKMASK